MDYNLVLRKALLLAAGGLGGWCSVASAAGWTRPVVVLRRSETSIQEPYFQYTPSRRRLYFISEGPRSRLSLFPVSPAGALESPVRVPAFASFYNDTLAFDDHGDLAVSWTAAARPPPSLNNPLESCYCKPRVMLRRAHAHFSRPQTLSPPSLNGTTPELSFTDTGSVLAVWLNGSDLRFSASARGRFAAPRTLASSVSDFELAGGRRGPEALWLAGKTLTSAIYPFLHPTPAGAPLFGDAIGGEAGQLVSDRLGDALQLGTESGVDGPTHLGASYRPPGGAFSPTHLVTRIAPPHSLCLVVAAMNQRGEVIAAWTCSPNEGASFGQAALLTRDGRLIALSLRHSAWPTGQPSVDINPGGRAVAAWQAPTGYFSVTTSAGRFGHFQAISKERQTSDNSIHVIITRSGKALATWPTTVSHTTTEIRMSSLSWSDRRSR